MRHIKTFLFYSVITLAVISCKSNKNEIKEEMKISVKAIDLNDLDTMVSPSEDFYQYATGGWQKNNPLPDEESRFGAFDMLAKETNQKVNDIITHLTEKELEENSIEWKIATFYKMGMDSVKIENDKLAPIEKILLEIEKISDKKELYHMLGKLHKYGFSPLFSIFGSADREDSEMEILYLYQGGLGLGNRDYYVNMDARSIEIREKYVEFIENMLNISGIDNTNARNSAGQIFDFEQRLAKKSMTNLELRDPYATTNRMSLSELNEISPNFDYQAYFNKIGLPVTGIINVTQPEFFRELSVLVNNIDLDVWKIYFKWNVLNSAASSLNKELVDANFDFYGKFLTGALVQQPRWRKIVNKTNSCLGEAVGQIFVNEYFPPEAKKRMDELVQNLRDAFYERIDNLDWMSDITKEKAHEKLNSITVKIGYPDKWKDYEKLNIIEDYYFSNIMRSNEFDFDEMISKIGKSVDKQEWLMNPQTVNAYYSPSRNEICFPAGILQPPFFYMDADDAVNYGAIGVVIGHEMTHGFDDKGRNYDKDGNLNDWWTEEDAKMFDERAKVLVDRFDNIEVLDDLYADGKLSLGENIADYGGLKISFDAFKKAQKGQKNELIDGFTPEQRFYLAYAKIWAQNIRDEEIIRRTKEDVHSLGKWRVNGQVPGIEDFIKAFNIEEGSPMYYPHEKRATIW
ncbi:MAG: M13 family metallopeptidase [Bacteroidales bacterium]|jgi:putative endopeptidase|nr:M13 family metallopeptidase [Bacteroidales bacterium]